MFRTGADVAELLRAIAASGDDWFRVWETEDGRFQVSDAAGSVAAIAIEAHWVEVRAGRPINAGSQTFGGGSWPERSLLRVHVSDGSPAMLIVCGRVYLDGFSLHTLMRTARDVLALAGPLLPDGERSATRTPAAAESATIEAPAEPGAPDAPIDIDQTSYPVADATEISSEPAASPPVEVGRTTGEGSSPVTVSPAESDEREAPEVAAPPDTESASPVEATPIAPTWTSSVGATVQIPRIPNSESVPTPGSVAAPRDAAPAAEGVTPVTCHRCGAEVQPGERFCINCGAAQGAPPQSSVHQTVARRSEPDTVIWRRPQPGDNQCARCGGANPKSNRYCQSCGATLRDG